MLVCLLRIFKLVLTYFVITVTVIIVVVCSVEYDFFRFTVFSSFQINVLNKLLVYKTYKIFAHSIYFIHWHFAFSFIIVIINTNN